MKKLDLNHALTFPSLHDYNEALNGLLLQEVLEFEKLAELIAQRDQVVLAYLDSLPVEAKQTFAKAELDCNQTILSAIKPLLNETEQDLKKLLRGKAAIKKYKGRR